MKQKTSYARKVITAGIAMVALSFGAAQSILAQNVQLTAAGSTFVQPLCESMVAEYTRSHPGVKIVYGGGGSGQGIKGITAKTLAFAGSDAPMTDNELKAAGGADAIIQIPSCAGGVVPAYNVPGVNIDLKFTGQLLADMYLGKVTNWNDQEVASLNPGVKLPDQAITPAYRSDGSGTNFVWTNYLSTQSDEFKSTVGIGKSVKWPLGNGGQGNPGVAAIIQSTAGAIGYLEQNYADKNNIKYGLVKNKAGKFVKASTDSVSKAGEKAASGMSGQILKANIWNADGDDVYPIAALTYFIAYKDLRSVHSKDEAQTVVNFLNFAVHDGQKLAPDLFYAPLSPAIVTKVDAAIGLFSFNGQPLKPQ